MDAGMPQPSGGAGDFWSHGLDRKFFSRVYTRSTIVGVVSALIFMGFEQRPIFLGILAGLLVGLFSLWSVEATVRLLLNGGKHAGLKLGFGALLKMPFLLAGVYVIASTAYSGILNVFAVVCGSLIVHGCMLVMVIATAMAYQDSVNERYR